MAGTKWTEERKQRFKKQLALRKTMGDGARIKLMTTKDLTKKTGRKKIKHMPGKGLTIRLFRDIHVPLDGWGILEG